MPSVLVVDDSAFMAKAVSSVVQEAGYDVVGLANDGIQGFDQFVQQAPDVTILDITMPNMDGLECLKAILEYDPDASVVMLSAIQDQEMIQECLNSGAVAFLKKPIKKNNAEDLERLRSTLEAAAGKAV